jgi:hypothetical protein
MKHLFAFSMAGALLLAACSNPKKPAPSIQSDSLAQADSNRNAYFPVAEYLEAEILQVDSSLLALKKFTSIQGRTDSVFIPVAEFNQLAMQFVPRELFDSIFEKNYTETSFQDKATRSITFTYAPADSNAELQRVDVLTVAGPRAQQVKSIYLEKTRRNGDSLILQKLLWSADQSFQIATIVQVKGKPAGEQQIRVVWNEPAAEG